MFGWVTWGWGDCVRFIIYWVSIPLNTEQMYVLVWTVGFIYKLCPLGSVPATDYSHNLWIFQLSPYAPEPLGPRQATGFFCLCYWLCFLTIKSVSCCLSLFLPDLTLKNCIHKVAQCSQVNSDIWNNFFDLNKTGLNTDIVCDSMGESDSITTLNDS